MRLPLLVSLLISPTWATAEPAVQDQDPCDPGRSAYGPSFVVPVEAAQGVTLGRGSPAPFAASLRVYPTYIIDRRGQLRLAAEAGAALVNPDVEALIGARITKGVFELNIGPVRGVGAHLGVEGLYGTSDRVLLGVMLIGDAGGVFQGTLRAAQDITHGATLLELGAGIHLYNGPTPEAPQVTRVPPRDYLGRVAERMAIDLKATLGDAREEGQAACRDLVSASRRFVEQRSPGIGTVAAFRAALRTRGLHRLETDMLEPDPSPLGTTEQQVVQALYRGMADVLGLRPEP
jgi:hypothetical protein